MPIGRLLRGSQLGADEIEILTRAFEKALRLLSLVDRDDPLSQLVARKIIEIGPTGVRDTTEIAKIAVKQLGMR